MCFRKFYDSVQLRNKSQVDNKTYDFFSIIEELGEAFTGIRKNLFHDKPLPEEHNIKLRDECGDVVWFLTRAMVVRTDVNNIDYLCERVDEIILTASLIDVDRSDLLNHMGELSRCLTSFFCSITAIYEENICFLEDKFCNVLFNLMMILKIFSISFESVLNYNIDKLIIRHGGVDYNKKYYQG